MISIKDERKFDVIEYILYFLPKRSFKFILLEIRANFSNVNVI